MLYLFQVIKRLSAAQVTVFSFILTSLLGGLLLTWTEGDREVYAKTPIILESTISTVVSEELNVSNASQFKQLNTYVRNISYKGERFVDMRFTAVSALCVTGLTSTDFSQFTLAGQMIVLFLIQIGGLGIILFTSLLAMMLVKGLTERSTFQGLLSSIVGTTQNHVVRMIKHIVLYTFLFEGLGMLIMGIYLSYFVDPIVLDGTNPRWRALFHSISAFNNAGFGLFNDNLMKFVLDPVINFTIAGLIIIGGLGYPVLIAIHAWIRWIINKRRDVAQTELFDDVKEVVASPVQIRVALFGTIFLILIGLLLPLLSDYSNPLVSSYTLPQQIMIHFFQSVSTRTAGFNTIDIGALSYATLFVYIGLMFVGANPGGTAGGIKIPTVAVLYGYLKDRFKKPGLPVTVMSRKVSRFAISHAIRLLFFSIFFIFIISYIIMIVEKPYLHTNDMIFTFSKILFEVVSAFGTVGLSMGYPTGVTSFSAILHPLSKILIIITMFFGRIGPLTVLDALPARKALENEPLSPDFDDVDMIQIG